MANTHTYAISLYHLLCPSLSHSVCMPEIFLHIFEIIKKLGRKKYEQIFSFLALAIKILGNLYELWDA